MKTIGEILKSARIHKKYSLKKLGQITKIKSGFIDSIEKEKWSALPPFPTVLGFVKSIAGAIGVDEKTAVAVLKRDYPPKNLSINPKPDVESHFMWSPKLTFFVGIAVFAAALFGYLTFQYIRFSSPPRLRVESPKEDQVVVSGSVLVFGTTDSDAKVTANNQPILVDENGKFSGSLDVTKDTREIKVTAVSRSGKSATISRKIDVE